MDDHTAHHDTERLAHQALNVVSAIKGRAQLTRRRLERADRLDRDRLAADLRTIEDQATQAGDLVMACRRAATTESAEPRHPAGGQT